ncbi:hypothetical protein ABIE67_007844 [Streptomyces sp. V4I8]|uniref:hypothetical protein n=1 Tax=Streptomyces sp. V4I8 TaxID=3156469 RepID=UPI00351250FC
MSTLTDLLPIRLGLFDRPARKPKHRAIDEVERLRLKQSWADLRIKTLVVQLDDLHHEHAEVIARIDERHGEIVRGLEAQITRLERRLEVSVLAEAAAAQTQEIDLRTLQERFAEGPVVALNQTPQARRSPDHVPGWVKDQAEPTA